MRASGLKPLRVPIPGDQMTVDFNVNTIIQDSVKRLNDLLAILQEQEAQVAALEAGHLRDRAMESPEALAAIVERARALAGQSPLKASLDGKRWDADENRWIGMD
jgi:hypothetical protein